LQKSFVSLWKTHIHEWLKCQDYVCINQRYPRSFTSKVAILQVSEASYYFVASMVDSPITCFSPSPHCCLIFLLVSGYSIKSLCCCKFLMCAHGCHFLRERTQGRRKNAMWPLVLWRTREIAKDNESYLASQVAPSKVAWKPSDFKDARHPYPAARPSIAPLPHLASCSTRSRPQRTWHGTPPPALAGACCTCGLTIAKNRGIQVQTKLGGAHLGTTKVHIASTQAQTTAAGGTTCTLWEVFHSPHVRNMCNLQRTRIRLQWILTKFKIC
jgi:hypothetical protein